MLDGQPPPVAGEQFVAVWYPSDRAGMDADVGFVEICGCRVTVTRRLDYSPGDRWGTEVWLKATTGLEAVCRKIARELAGDNTGNLDTQSRYLTLIAANQIIGIGTPPNYYDGGFVTPLRLVDLGVPEPKGWMWFSSVPPEDTQPVYSGVAQTITLTGALRGQVLSEMT
jgi:hypothetical protein